MTGLLVSVRSAAEAVIALEAGADLIDVKEPNAGALGAASSEIVAGVVRAVAGRRPVSVALGELIDCPIGPHPALADPNVAGAIRFAKLGLAGCEPHPDWRLRWQAALKNLPAQVSPVAVVYADWVAARAPSPDEVLAEAIRLDCRALLVDTFDKRGPGLLGLWTPTELARHVATARESGMLVVLAGQVTADQIGPLMAHDPDYIAVRGAVCHPDRRGTVEADRISRLRQRIGLASGFATCSVLKPRR